MSRPQTLPTKKNGVISQSKVDIAHDDTYSRQGYPYIIARNNLLHQQEDIYKPLTGDQNHYWFNPKSKSLNNAEHMWAFMRLFDSLPHSLYHISRWGKLHSTLSRIGTLLNKQQSLVFIERLTNAELEDLITTAHVEKQQHVHSYLTRFEMLGLLRLVRLHRPHSSKQTKFITGVPYLTSGATLHALLYEHPELHARGLQLSPDQYLDSFLENAAEALSMRLHDNRSALLVRSFDNDDHLSQVYALMDEAIPLLLASNMQAAQTIRDSIEKTDYAPATIQHLQHLYSVYAAGYQHNFSTLIDTADDLLVMFGRRRSPSKTCSESYKRHHHGRCEPVQEEGSNLPE